jgi:diadenosine tetraphosphate (Ap4A) HIT family hydrolase
VVPETPEEFYARALAAADADGRLAMPPVGDWDTFPFEGDIRVRPITAPLDEERPRAGVDEADCWRCRLGVEGAVWWDDRWLLAPPEQPSGLPVVVILQPRAHHDIDDLPAELQVELGPMLVRAEAAVRAVGEIGRVHVCRWGDGSHHLHWWLMARPARVPQTVGSFAAIWDDILPPLPEEIWRENLAIVAHAMAARGGVAHV